MEERKLPLSGIKVIELATVVAAPTTARVLCSYGAEVIKVEALHGDDHRGAGAFEFVVHEGDKNPLFTIQNTGKRFTSINLKSEDGKEAFLKLLSEADVFLTNVRMPSLKRMGLDYDSVHELFPKLIFAHFSGYGLKGDDAGKSGFDFTAFWLRTGPLATWQAPGSAPFSPTYAFGDMATSSIFLSGILMALIGREKSGKGTFVGTSLLGSGVWCSAINVVSHQEQFDGQRVVDPLKPADPFYYTYQCKDGRWIGIADNDYIREVPKFAKLLDFPWMLEDEKYSCLQSLHETGAVVDVTKAVIEKMKEKTAKEWINYLEENNVSCELMQTIREVSHDPQAIANGYIEEVVFRDDLHVNMPCPPITFSEYEKREYTPAKDIGADTDQIFAELGYTEEQIEKMRESKSIR